MFFCDRVERNFWTNIHRVISSGSVVVIVKQTIEFGIGQSKTDFYTGDTF